MGEKMYSPPNVEGKKFVDLGEESVAAKLPGVPLAVAADGFGKVLAMLVGFARQDGGTAKSVEDPGNAGQRCVGIAFRPLLGRVP